MEIRLDVGSHVGVCPWVRQASSSTVRRKQAAGGLGEAGLSGEGNFLMSLSSSAHLRAEYGAAKQRCEVEKGAVSAGAVIGEGGIVVERARGWRDCGNTKKLEGIGACGRGSERGDGCGMRGGLARQRQILCRGGDRAPWRGRRGCERDESRQKGLQGFRARLGRGALIFLVAAGDWARRRSSRSKRCESSAGWSEALLQRRRGSGDGASSTKVDVASQEP
uniref:Uncharacterized protein n=1 Tax=Setaria viridis TaxID=4556 RepID=A0A4U6UZT8_SETVI|nr:hypothetical protein SEVIR_4G124000v2 [Setaria viridis]